MDNAANNNTFMEALERDMRRRQIPFKRSERRIRYGHTTIFNFTTFSFSLRCFPHVVNLACQTVLKAITNIALAAEVAEDFVPATSNSTTFAEGVSRDPIAVLRSLIRFVRCKDAYFILISLLTSCIQIRASSLRRQRFENILESLGQKTLQLLRDVETRWSSTYLMIERAFVLREVRKTKLICL